MVVNTLSLGLNLFILEIPYVTYFKGVHLYFLQNESFVAFRHLSITVMFTEPVPKVRMDSGGEKCQTLFSLHLLSCPVLDGYNYYLGVGSCNKLKGGSWKQMSSKDQKYKQQQGKGNKQARLTAPALMLKLIWEAECQGRFLAGEQETRRQSARLQTHHYPAASPSLEVVMQKQCSS